MKITTVSALSLCLLASCGGASEEGDRNNETVRGDDDSEEDDDASGSSDDDGEDADDDASGDDDGDDTGDDTPGDDTPDPGMDPVPPSTGVIPPAGTSMPPMMVPVPAEGCTTVGQSQSTTSCDIRESCSNAYKYTWCSQLTNGNWSCQCSDGFVGYDLEVTGETPPCETVREECSSIEAPQFTGETTCGVDYQSASVDYCEVQERCTEAVPVTDEISVVQSLYENAYCYNNGAGALQCSCSGTAGSKSFTLSGVDVATSCATASSLCDAEVAPEPVGEETCTLNAESAGTNYCQRQQTCSQTIAIDGAEAALTETQVGSCSTDANGLTTCSCYGGTKSYSYQASTSATDPATCVTAIDLCNSDEAPVPEGPIDCALNQQSASTTSCNAYIQCTQDATVGDTTIGLFGTISAYCNPSGDAWSCQCISGNQSATITLESADAWTACTDAAMLCPDEVEVQVGSSGSPCGYPVPVTMSAAPASRGMASGGSADIAVAPANPAPGIAVPCTR